MSARRAAAVAALGLGLIAAALAAGFAGEQLPAGLLVLAALALATLSVWYAFVRRGAVRAVAVAAAAVGIAAAAVLAVAQGRLHWALVAALIAAASACAARAFGGPARLPP